MSSSPDSLSFLDPQKEKNKENEVPKTPNELGFLVLKDNPQIQKIRKEETADRAQERQEMILDFIKNEFGEKYTEKSIQKVSKELFEQEKGILLGNSQKDVLEITGLEIIKSRLEEKKEKKSKISQYEELKQAGKTNTEIITILLQQHNDKEITLSAENYGTLKQWESLLNEPLIPAEIRNSLPQKINDGGVNIFDSGAFSQFVTSEIYNSDQIDEKQKQQIAEKLGVPYLRTGSDVKKFAKKFAKENPGESFEFRGKQVRATESGKLEIKVGENKTFAIAPGIEGEEIGERVNYSLVSNLLDKYRLSRIRHFFPLSRNISIREECFRY